jgi:hypothetical protein
MAGEERTLKFWNEVERRVKDIPGGRRYAENLRKKYLDTEYAGEEVLCLKGGLAYQKALEMVLADVEYMSGMDRVRRLDKRRSLKQEDFWLTILEETGHDEDSGLVFDPLKGRVFRNHKPASEANNSSNTHRASLDGYRELIEAALLNPLAASRMVNDPFLKFQEIKQMADAITKGDFKPKLRQLLEDWIGDPSKARQYLPLLEKENMPRWLVEIAAKLGQRKKWSLNSDDNQGVNGES